MIGEFSAKEFVAQVIVTERDSFPSLILRLPESGKSIRSFSMG
jgi:hypothetical protein